MKRIVTGFLLCAIFVAGAAQNKTDISLSKKGSGEQFKEIVSPTGDMYKLVEHHGPAVENEWIGLRLYFDYKCAIDVYNKTRPGLELAEAGWYPTPEQQKEGWGADQYKVGQTVGLGGVRLWDGEKELFLNPVKDRIARVRKEADFSQMEMLSEGIPYKGDSVDILIRVTVFSGFREAKVEAFALCDKPVEFLTGINYFPTTKTAKGENYICTWGMHPEDVAAYQLNIGGAIIYNPDDYSSISKAEKQYMLISKPTKYLATWVTSACEKEKDFKTMDQFVEYVKEKAK
ncbi:DUF4861 family protein [Saccharicrinis sp. FJH54]|uniref:DUF4861 family protein n=1 Tax=Saccharicrinis sp. FJH54 TaxID=3344665 RepID=UPI0035D48F2B